jgi:hypothetical protein
MKSCAQFSFYDREDSHFMTDEFHFMTDEFHFMTDKFHFMTEPTTTILLTADLSRAAC